MANSSPILERISGAIEQLCETINACWLDFFQPNTLEKNELESSRARSASQLRYLIPTGTYAAGVWSPGEEIRLVCMGSNSPPIFWRYVAEVLGLEELERVVKVGEMEFSAAEYSKKRSKLLDQMRVLSWSSNADCSFHLHYCPIPQLFDANVLKPELIPPYSSLVHSLRVEESLDMVRDMHALAFDVRTKCVVDMEHFRAQYCVLRHWAKASGLLAPQLGFLSSMDLLWMLHSALTAGISPKAGAVVVSLEQTLLRRFFEFFASRYPPSEDVGDMLLVITSPTNKHIDKNFTLTSRRAITTTIHRTFQNWDLDTEAKMACMTSRDEFQRFFGQHINFLKVDCMFWGDTPMKLREWQNVVNENLMVIVKYYCEKFDGELGFEAAYLWPMPLTDGTDERKMIFAIGLGDVKNKLEEVAMFDRAATKLIDGAFIFDRTQGDILVTFAGPSDFEGLKFEGEGAATTQEVASSLGSLAYRPKSQAVSTTQNDTAATMSFGNLPFRPAGQRPFSSTRFRTTNEAINRLRHDPAHANLEYEVGYEDRFEGLKWMGLEDWGGKQTEDEDFIPLHRVVQLRRSEDGVVVWDREKREDRTDGI